MPVVVEVADDRNVDPNVGQATHDLWHGGGGGLVVHGHANELRPGGGERCRLRDGELDVGSIRVRHRLDDDGMRTANGDVTDEWW